MQLLQNRLLPVPWPAGGALLNTPEGSSASTSEMQPLLGDSFLSFSEDRFQPSSVGVGPKSLLCLPVSHDHSPYLQQALNLNPGGWHLFLGCSMAALGLWLPLMSVTPVFYRVLATSY